MKQDTNFCKIRAVMEKKYGNFAWLGNGVCAYAKTVTTKKEQITCFSGNSLGWSFSEPCFSSQSSHARIRAAS